MKTSRTARCRLPFRLLSILLATTPLFTTSLFADSCNDAAGRLESAEGSVAVTGSSGSWQPLAIGDCIPVDSQVKVSNGRAVFRLANETLLRTAGETQLRFSSPQQKRWIHLIDGLLHLITRTPRDLEVESEYVNAAVKGTEFIVASDKANASGQVIVLEGEVVASNGEGYQAVTGGNAVVARAGAAPQSITVPALRDAVQWTLHFPPLPLPSQPRFASVNNAIKAGDLSAALRELDATPESQRDAEYLTMRAAIDLQRGEVNSAQTLLQQVTTNDSNNSTALALQAATEIASGNNDRADELLARSQSDDTIALITRSYLQQARFDLPAALTTAEQAAELNSSNAWVQARVAELALMNGDTRRADEAIQRALTLNPNHGRANALNGFLQLQRLNLDAAEKAFTQAAKLDSSDPMPRLGLGLIEIRHNNLTAGREQLELAVALDPGQSLLRSYLGKAYQLEQRDALAGDQYALAKTFDDADPTPWLYGSLLAQSQNRPFEALQMIEESIKRNDNRAVYRSRQQLDGDEATRTASQAAIYRQLGFNELAQNIATNAVTTAPSESSTHRQLAESYAERPDYDAARASEVLQAQLTQPLSSTPIQPLLAESNLLINDNAGPNALGSREYSALFVRERPYLQFAGIGGSNKTGSGEISISGISDRFSYAIDQYHYETQGYRENNNAKYDISSVMGKYQVSENTTTTLTYTQREDDIGAIEESLQPSENSPLKNQETKSKSTLLGLHFNNENKADLLAAVSYSEISGDQQTSSDATPFPFTSIAIQEQRNSHASNAELQTQIHEIPGSLIIGADWSEIEDSFEIFESTDLVFPPFKINSTTNRESTTRYQTGYTYWTAPLTSYIKVTTGIAIAEYDTDLYEEKFTEWLPKFSINISPTKNLIIKAAYFENLKRPKASEQTLEPTQIGGLNQFFDETTGIKSDQYGFGFDWTVNSEHRTGAEFSARTLKIPSLNIDGELSKDEAKHNTGTFYWSWGKAPLAMNLAYWYNRSEYRDTYSVGLPSPLETHKIPLTLKWISNDGITLSATATHFKQKADFPVSAQGDNEYHEEFSLLDIEASYTFPKSWIKISAYCNNIGNKSFRYQNTTLYDTTPQISPYIPERTFLLGLKLNY